MEKDKVYSFIFQFPAFPRSLYHNIHKLLKAIATMYKHTINKARTPCPKCKKGSFLQGRSLTVHMNQCEVADVKLSDTFDYVEHNKKGATMIVTSHIPFIKEKNPYRKT